MIERIPTLIFHANSVPHWRRVVVDTFVGISRLRPEMLPAGLRRRRRVRFLFDEEYRTLSYLVDWKEAFCEASVLDERLCNINNLVEFTAGLRQLRRYPLAIILHSAAGDNLSLLRWAAGYFKDRRGKLLVFFGNEYNAMPDKIGFARDVAADYIATQLPRQAADWLYADCRQSKVLLAPPALNPKLYQPQGGKRPIDIGFRGQLYAHMYTLGDIERTKMLRLFADHTERWGLVKDIEFMRYPRVEWSHFLGTCKGTIGAESGTYYLERDDRTQEAVKEFLAEHPSAEFHEVYDRFFKGYPNPVSGKAISSRHFEPIGTKTCQILLDGQYNGILKADEHFIALKQDYSNIDDVIRRFKDEGYRRTTVDRAYDYVTAQHTYRQRVDGLLKVLLEDKLPC
jgi:glycosyl transferase family 1